MNFFIQPNILPLIFISTGLPVLSHVLTPRTKATEVSIQKSQIYCLRRRRSKPSVYSVCELVHNIVFESCRVARTYVGVFDWLISYTVCD